MSYVLARNFRRFRAGRVATAVRDNERAAAALGVNPRVAKLSAFTLSGALAGLAGGLYVIAQQGIGFNGYNVENSFAVFSMVVVGGLGSLPGALIGAIYYEGCQYFLTGGAQLLATGAGLTLLIMFVPGGLGEILFNLRDLVLRRIAVARGLSVPFFTARAGAAGETILRPDDDTGAVAPTPVTPRVAAVNGDRAPQLLVCHGLDAGYDKVQVLFHVDLDVGDGEIVALLGTNGSGKSTVLRVLSGLLAADQGSVHYAGTDITRADPIDRVRQGIVMVPGGRGVFPSLTVAENLRMGGWLRRHDPRTLGATPPGSSDYSRCSSDGSGTRAGDLSGGEQQMLTLSQALLCEPRLLLIDELSLGLAPTVVAGLLDVVRELAMAGTTIVVVEQSLNVAASLAQRGVFLERGAVRFNGRTAELAERPDLARSVFLAIGTGQRAVGPTTIVATRRFASPSTTSPSTSAGSSLSTTSASRPGPAKCSGSSARTGRGRQRSSTCARASCAPTRGRSSSTARTSRR